MTRSLMDDFCLAARTIREDILVEDPAVLTEYGKDWTTRWTPSPSAVAFPRSTEEVSELLKLCDIHQIPVVPSGGRTGLSGGAVAQDGELVLSLDKMAKIGPLDPIAGTLEVQAGAITEAVHTYCEEHGLTWPIDLAAKGSSQIGGNLSTNAGGVRVIRYGSARQWVLGMRVVTARGEILELNRALEKNNTGLDLRQLFIGSEGTLGIITEATLKLTRLNQSSQVMLLGVSGIDAGLEVLGLARKHPTFDLLAFEYFTQACMGSVEKRMGLRSPFEAACPGYILVEVETHGQVGALEEWLEELFSTESVLDGVLAASAGDAKKLWGFRENITESLARAGKVHKNDVSVPINRLRDFAEFVDSGKASRSKALLPFYFGHLGDGNLHLNLLKPDAMPDKEFLELTAQSDHDIYGFLESCGGSISAEHGIGLLKKDYLHYSRTPAEIAVMRELKKVMDPRGILNPGKILPAT